MFFQLIGRFHPLIVHFPIGILLLAFVFEMLSWIGGLKKLKAAVQPALLIGAITSVFSVVTGLTLAEEGGYDEDLLSMHRNLGIATSIISFLVYFLRKKNFSLDKIVRRRIRFMLLMPVVLFVSLTGHWGGSMTHGEDYLTGILLASVEETPGEVNYDSITNVDDALMYADLVKPILEAKCYACHSSVKQKGQLRLDGPEYILKGGKHGDVVDKEIPDSSAMYYRLLLPVENKKHMPPEEKPQLSSAEIDIIHSWVNGGHSFDKKVSALSDRERIREFVSVIQATHQQKNTWIPETEVAEAGTKVIDALKEKGILVIPVSQESNYLMINFINARSAGDKEMELLLPLRDQLVWLNLERTAISNSALETIGKLSNLRVLYLNNTKVDDDGVEKLAGLKELVYLNLVGTGISDGSLMTLKGFAKLESLYLYGTKVSKDSVSSFILKHGDLRADTGRYYIPFLPTDTLVFKTK